jgi:hypothetical protein
MEFFGILRCAQDDSNGKGKDKGKDNASGKQDNGRGRFSSGMTTKKKSKSNGLNEGSLHYAMDGETVLRFGRDDASW